MLASLLLQVLSLVPPAPSQPAEPDSPYAQQIGALAQQDVWPQASLHSLKPSQPQQQMVLAGLMLHGTDAEVRLAALLGSGCDGEGDLGRACWRRALLDFDARRSLACLLAPATVPQEVFPLLAWIVTDPDRSLGERAAACARLLDGDSIHCWPWVAAILRTGTAADKKTSLANWARKGRYELPKRILLLSLQNYLQRHHLDPTTFEPNAAWKVQEAAVQQLASTLQPLLDEAWIPPHPLPASWVHLNQLFSSPHGAQARSLLGELKKKRPPRNQGGR